MHYITHFGMTRQLLIKIQLLPGISYHFFRYNITIADWDIIENLTNGLDVLFVCLVAANLHYGSFGELVEGLFLLPISDIPKDPIIDIYYRQYNELVVGLHPTFHYDCYKKDALNVDEMMIEE